MATRFDFEGVAATILAILDEGHYTTWTRSRLAAAVCKRAGCANQGKVSMIIASLVTSGKIDGVFRNGQPVNICWKDPADSTTQAATDPATEERVKALHRTCESLRKTVETVTNERNAAMEAVIKASEQVRATKASDRIVEVRLVREEKDKTKTVKSTTGTFHKCFEKLLKLARARMNIFIYGPTGCGKSHVCGQLAESLDLPFYFVSCTSGMSEGIIGGRLLPVGKQGTFEYVTSEFVKAYETGGIFLLDEIDAADPNVLLFVNAALANGKVAVSNRPECPYAKRHADFICVAAANTVGTGADRLYTGRNKLDAATLDRFQIGKVVMDYDPTVEATLCPEDALRNRLLKYRAAINAHRLERAMSTRFMRDAHTMIMDYEFDMNDVDEAFFSGWREDEVNKVREYIRQH